MTTKRMTCTMSLAAFAGAVLGAGVARADEPQPPGATPSETRAQSPELESSTIYFSFDGAQLDAASKAELDRVAAWMNENDQRTVVIAGHTDEVGSADYNVELGDRRAKAAAAYLAQQGIDRGRIELRTYGEARAASDTDWKNRRAVFFATRAPTGSVANASQGRDGDLELDAEAELETETEPELAAEADTDFEVETDAEFEAEADTEVPEYAMAPVVIDVDDGEPDLITPDGMAITVGGGVTGQIDGDVRDFIDEGGAWEARLTYGTRAPLAFEAAYVGSAQDISALGLDDDTVLLGSGVEAAARLNLLDDAGVQPYVFGGVGWTHYDLVNDSFNTSNVGDDDNTLQIPVGAGVGLRGYGALLDLRGTVRPVFDDQLMDAATANAEDARLDNWNVSAKVGWEF